MGAGGGTADRQREQRYGTDHFEWDSCLFHFLFSFVFAVALEVIHPQERIHAGTFAYFVGSAYKTLVLYAHAAESTANEGAKMSAGSWPDYRCTISASRGKPSHFAAAARSVNRATSSGEWSVSIACNLT